MFKWSSRSSLTHHSASRHSFAPALFAYTIVIGVNWHMQLAFLMYGVHANHKAAHESIRREVTCNFMPQYLGDENASEAGRRAAELQRVITDFQRSEGDTGSSEVQGAVSLSVKGRVLCSSVYSPARDTESCCCLCRPHDFVIKQQVLKCAATRSKQR